MSVKVTITDNQKKIKLPTGTRLLIRKACTATLKLEGFDDPSKVEVTLENDDTIREMNNKFRNIDASTDVLSFPLGENGVYDKNLDTGACLLGDIVISVETAVRQAETYGHSLQREIGFLTVHSMLHLLGYDHVESKLEESIMREKQEIILGELGLAINKL